MALRRGEVSELWCDRQRRDERMEEIRRAARESGAPVHEISGQELNLLLPGVRHQGVVGLLHPAREWSERELRSLLEGLERPPFLLILDGVQDPHNLGACLRTADAAGVDAVIAPRDRAAGLTPAVRKVACGAAQSLPFIRVTNLARTLRELRKAGVWLVGAAGDSSQEIYQADLRGSLALVMGAEGRGLRRLTREHCDLLVKIPMSGVVESLNVSVAAAICLYEALRQRRGS
ncbi:MAG TPA: 23S rRNA (guanosine(2251)-2'-O)-methyltransferase RlmB [Gammaproteobacteria bacterium]|nr:23S rRNA (guanosine(2251)-2'-O)-methyltransferase RlmB [Gammaproteobacteria bacterium]